VHGLVLHLRPHHQHHLGVPAATNKHRQAHNRCTGKRAEPVRVQPAAGMSKLCLQQAGT
jgi:hypothetical protein